jgi:hypothetical protein
MIRRIRLISGVVVALPHKFNHSSGPPFSPVGVFVALWPTAPRF